MESVEIWVRRCAAKMDEAGLFFGHGTDNAWDEAAWLVLHAIGEDPTAPFDDWSRPMRPAEASAAAELLARRIETRQPLAYVLGESWFCGLRFAVGPGALVPRSPLAELIARRFQPWLGDHRPRRALDLCTGGGCIAVAMAHHFPELSIDASDISESALDIARRNVTMHGMTERIRLVMSDGFAAFREEVYDLVVSNPPYVPELGLAALPEEYRAEPALGLLSGEDGLDLPLRLLFEVADHLAPEGRFFCEVGESEGRLQAALEGVPFTWLEFEQGGAGVFTMDRKQLEAARPMVAAALEKRGHVV